jgi:hypothetical protein
MIETLTNLIKYGLNVVYKNYGLKPHAMTVYAGVIERYLNVGAEVTVEMVSDKGNMSMGRAKSAVLNLIELNLLCMNEQGS